MTPVANEQKQNTCHGVRDEHRCVSKREHHAAQERWPRDAPEAGGWMGEKEKGAPVAGPGAVCPRRAAEMTAGRTRRRWVGGREDVGPSSLDNIISTTIQTES